MSFKTGQDDYPLRTFTDRDWGDTSRLLYHEGYGTTPLTNQRSRVAPRRNGTESLPRDGSLVRRDDRTSFFDHVVLDPGWEGNHTRKDIVGFTLMETVEHMRKNPPPDRYNAVFIIMLIQGIAITIPWNMFLTAKAYFEDYKLNATGVGTNEYKRNYISYVLIASQVPQVVLNAINMLSQRKRGPSSPRIVISLLLMVGLIIGTTVLAMIDSSAWPGIFFGVTIATVVLLNMCTGIYMNNIFGLSATLPMKYTNAVVVGTNVSGVVTALAIILSIALSPGVKTCAIYYFLTAIIVLLIAFDSYFALPHLKFYRHYQAIISVKHSANAGAVIKEKRKRPLLHIFKQIWGLLFSVWFLFFSTVTIFPAMQGNTSKIDRNFPITDVFWSPIFCFLSFGAFATLGNILTQWLRRPSGKFLWIPVVLRGVIFIPFFLLCNYRSETRTLAVLINNDYAFIAGGVLMALTHGYFSSLAMMYGPAKVETEYASTAGMILSLAICLGILCGANFALVVTIFVEKVGAG